MANSVELITAPGKYEYEMVRELLKVKLEEFTSKYAPTRVKSENYYKNRDNYNHSFLIKRRITNQNL